MISSLNCPILYVLSFGDFEGIYIAAIHFARMLANVLQSVLQMQFSSTHHFVRLCLTPHPWWGQKSLMLFSFSSRYPLERLLLKNQKAVIFLDTQYLDHERAQYLHPPYLTVEQ
ncbi:hypothetical protein ACQKL0_16335 [Peribacillus sp. NPDC097264]|uniref:hypothetical protein n=1 Tax=Peribacillus sp. NPDC097264 TaxID=3390616 RepID=UPI003CFF7D1D